MSTTAGEIGSAPPCTAAAIRPPPCPEDHAGSCLRTVGVLGWSKNIAALKADTVPCEVSNAADQPKAPLPSPRRNGFEIVESCLTKSRPRSRRLYLLARVLTEPTKVLT